MAEQSQWETVKGESGHVLERVKELVHQGNIRRIVVRQGDRTIAEFPLTFGVLWAVVAPVLAAVGAIAALVTDCTIDLEKVVSEDVAAQSDVSQATTEEIVDL